MLLNVSLGDSRIQLTMYNSEGGVEKDHLFVYSRIGKRLICGDSPRMITSYKHIYSIELDDLTNPGDLVASTDSKEATSQENKNR